MTIKTIKDVGVQIHVTKEVAIIYNKKHHNVTVFKNKDVVNKFDVDPNYKVSEFFDFVDTVTNQLKPVKN